MKHKQISNRVANNIQIKWRGRRDGGKWEHFLIGVKGEGFSGKRHWSLDFRVEWAFPGGSTGKEPTCHAGDPWFYSLIRKIPWRSNRPSTPVLWGFPGGSAAKEPTWNVGSLGSIPGLGRSPGRGHGNPLQYSCLESPVDAGAAARGVAKSQTRLRDWAHGQDRIKGLARETAGGSVACASGSVGRDGSGKSSSTSGAFCDLSRVVFIR